MTRQRIEPTPRQLAEAKKLLDTVPTESRFIWNDSRAEKFCAYIAALKDEGIPVAWLAEHLGVSATVLNQQILRYKASAA